MAATRAPEAASSLVARARISAIAEVRALFHNASQLSQTSRYQHQYELKKQQTEARLSSAIRSLALDTRRGLQLLDAAAASVASVEERFRAIDAYCGECKALLKNFDAMKRVSVGKRNLVHTRALQEQFRRVPEQAAELAAIIDGDDGEREVKGVYLMLRTLVRLHQRATRQAVEFTPQVSDSAPCSFLLPLALLRLFLFCFPRSHHCVSFLTVDRLERRTGA
jgi:hypothetical protein